MTVTPEEREAALERAREIIALVRERGFKNGGEAFSDAQIWQAICDVVRERPCGHLHDAVAVRLIEQVISGETPAEAAHFLAAPREKGQG
jgi:DNA invertase Pin-like site-specific DNA recombinase